MQTQHSRALQHVVSAEREAARIPALQGARACDVEITGVAGAGTMGSGIAVALLGAGYRVIVIERDAAAAGLGHARINAILERNLASGRLSMEEKSTQLARLTTGYDLQQFAPCDLVIEAVYDDLEIKRALFTALAGIVRRDCILATNTSYLNPEAIARDINHPERAVGMHFFAPAHIMRLMEAVRTRSTTPDVLATAIAVAKTLRKLPIFSGVCEGFIGNRMYSYYRRQCEFMLEEGAYPQDIDQAMEDWGLPMGPFRAFDLSGLDIAWALRKRQDATRDTASRYSPIADRLCEMGRFGQKTKAGWYRYENGKPLADEITHTIIEKTSREKGLTRRRFSAAEIRLRLVAALANEAARLLEEGIALRASDVDLVYLNGYGWPKGLGGPIFQANEWGLSRILDEVKLMHRRDGSGFAPAPLLVQAVRDNSGPLKYNQKDDNGQESG